METGIILETMRECNEVVELPVRWEWSELFILSESAGLTNICLNEGDSLVFHTTNSLGRSSLYTAISKDISFMIY